MASVSVSSERRGGRNNKYQAKRCIAMHDMTSSGARGALSRYEVIPVKGETSGKVSPVFRVFEQMKRRGESCVFAMLGMCGGQTGCVSKFVSSF